MSSHAAVHVTAAPSRPSPPASSTRAAAVLQRCGDHPCGSGCKKHPLQRSGAGASAPGIAPPIVGDVLRSSGRALDANVRTAAEARFAHDFSGVRVHTDARAAESARAVGARAYTVGAHLVFGAGAYDPSTSAGRRVLDHELTHVVQQRMNAFTAGEDVAMLDDPALEADADRGATTAVHAARTGVARLVLQRLDKSCFAAGATEPAPGACSFKVPEDCATYEQWVSMFTRLPTFEALTSPKTKPDASGKFPAGTSNVFDVIGDKPALRYGAKGGNVAAPITTAKQLGEEFIDHPTDTWVKNCLPEHLRATAYQLPADCADVMLILRHVWLAAHNRTETFKAAGSDWIIGAVANPTRKVNRAISDIGTINIAPMVQPYKDSNDNEILTIADLDPLLHPGDLLVWAHHDKGLDKSRTGGHAHTIAEVRRNASGKITEFVMLQGNQPIFDREKTEIIKEKKLADTDKTRKELGKTPGRRIERDVIKRNRFDDGDVGPKGATHRAMLWDSTTALIAAGPARAAARPGLQKGSKVRQLSDWNVRFKAARSRNDLLGPWEALLSEARATIEGGDSISDDQLKSVGEAAGNALWRLAKAAKGFGESHMPVIDEMRAMLEGFRTSRGAPSGKKTAQDAITERLRAHLARLDQAFVDAARGGATIDFPTGKRAAADVNVLLTGFDPFNTVDVSKRPRKGEWNPSGVAVMALDATSVSISGKSSARVQSIVLPVSFPQFAAGIVERIVRPHVNEIDAAISVSVDPGLSLAAPVRLERWAVGVHHDKVLERIGEEPGLASGTPAGAAFIESNAPLDEIKNAPLPKKGPQVTQPTIGEDVQFDVLAPANARDVLNALGGASVGNAVGSTLIVTDPAALRRIAATMVREKDGVTIGFTVGKKKVRAKVQSGPGGNFLSNEVSYRLLRLLARSGGARDPMSFHVHTEQGNIIPSDVSTKQKRAEREKALREAGDIKGRLVATLKWIIASVGRVVLKRRAAKTKAKTP